MQSNSTRSDSDPEPSATETGDATPAASQRSDAYRERFRQTQAIAAQIARARAAGGTPSDEQAARLIAEFQARGGRVTICPPSDTDSSTGQENSSSGRAA